MEAVELLVVTLGCMFHEIYYTRVGLAGWHIPNKVISYFEVIIFTNSVRGKMRQIVIINKEL